MSRINLCGKFIIVLVKRINSGDDSKELEFIEWKIYLLRYSSYPLLEFHERFQNLANKFFLHGHHRSKWF